MLDGNLNHDLDEAPDAPTPWTDGLAGSRPAMMKAS